MKPQALCFIPTLSLLSLVANAQFLPNNATAQYQSPITILNSSSEYYVNQDYSYTENETNTIKINSQVGVNQFSQIPISYNPALEKVEITAAYTTKANGEKIEVKPSAILDRQSAASQNAPMFNNDRVKTIIFPNTAIGDTLTFSIKKEAKPLFPRSFSIKESLPPILTQKHGEISINIPDNMALHTDVYKMTAATPVKKDGRKIFTWTSENQQGVAPEPGIAKTLGIAPMLFATTFNNEQSAADAYLARSSDKAEVTETIRKKADEITQGISDKKAQAKAIYNWVSGNIRYVAVYFGVGGVVPHSADEILKNGYGDCKDHVTLLSALLSAKNIPSQPVLINAGSFYGIPKVAVMPGVFDHVITYLPDYDLYLDSTAEVATFGELPVSEVGKQALLVDKKNAKIVTLPQSTPQDNGVKTIIRMTLNKDGGATGEAEITQKGTRDWVARLMSINMPKGVESQFAQKMLQATGQSGSGRYQFGEARDLDKPYVYHSQFTLSNVFDTSDDGAFRLPLGLGAFNGINNYTFGSLTGINTRKFPFALNGVQIDTTTEITLPENMTLDKLPKDIDFHNELGEYQAHYRLEKDMLNIHRVLTIKQKNPVSPADSYAQVKALNDTINKDLHHQAFYKMKSN